MSEELKACPFCGSSHVTKGLTGATEKFLGISDSDRNRRWFAHIQCLDCGTKQGRLESYIMDGRDDEDAYAEAITAWNTRATDAENQRLRAEVEALRDDVEAKRHAIDRDRYIVSSVLQAIRKEINGHRWLLEGRGPYEWDDDRYREEFSDWLDNVEGAAENLAKLAWDKSDSETDEARISAAREAARKFLIEKRPRDRKVLPSDLGLPCPTCNQIASNALTRKAPQ